MSAVGSAVRKELGQDDLELAELVPTYWDRPYDWVMDCYPWGDPTTILSNDAGPDEWQTEFLKTLQDEIQSGKSPVRMSVASGHGVGKAMPHDLLIDTPIGRRRFGDLEVGDWVFGRDGRPVKVTGIFEQGIKPVYRVGFEEGSSTECCAEHLWTVRGRNQRRTTGEWVTRSLGELALHGVTRKNGKMVARQWEIPVPNPLQYPTRWTPVDPYTMGAWLGDGTRRSARIAGNDTEIPQHIRDAGYRVTGRQARTCMMWHVHDLQAGLRIAGVYQFGAHHKTIPECYLFNSIEVRQEILRGLLDTDGTVTTTGCIQYDTVSFTLAEQVAWLARSLGGIARLASVNRQTGLSYRVSMTLPAGRWFYVQRKQDRVRHTTQKRYLSRWLSKIQPAGEKPCRCITVDAPDQLYVANDGIVTHNTALVAWLIHWFISVRNDPQIVVTANTQQQLNNKTWRELAKWQKLAINGHWFDHTATQYKLKAAPETWFATAVPWSKERSEAFAGTHEANVMVIYDEASGVADIIWEVTEGAMTTPGAIWLVFGNPTKPTGRFKECWGRFKKRWVQYQVDARKAAHTNKQLIEEWIEDHGIDSDFVRIRVLGRFPKVGPKQFIGTDLVEAAVRRIIKDKDIPGSQPKLMGVDVAREGDDECVIVLRQGRKMKKEIIRFHERDTMKFASFVAAKINDWQPDIVFIDAVGVGAGVYDRLIQLGFDNVVEVHGGDSPLDEKTYFNVRCEIWGRMRDWLSTADIPDDANLLRELTTPEFYYDEKLRIRLERKQDIKARGEPSPDTADALSMTFAQPVPTKRDNEQDLEPDEP